MFDLTGKTAVITGGSRGIGYGIAAGMARMGADIVVAARTGESVRSAANELKTTYRVKALGVVTDVKDEAQINALVEQTMADFGRIDILVNNAGMMVAKLPQDIDVGEWDDIMAVNLKSAFLCAKAVYPAMKSAGSGKIICIGSMYSIFGGLMSTAYGATKGGVVALVRSLAVAWAPDNIQVNAILPGWINTEMGAQARRDMPGLNESVLNRTPAKRWGETSDLIGAMVFLASNASDFVTGAALPVDGGFSIFLI